jgi:hypothetical protein
MLVDNFHTYIVDVTDEHKVLCFMSKWRCCFLSISLLSSNLSLQFPTAVDLWL